TALLPACGGPAKTRVGFVTNNPAEFWNIAEAGAKKAAAEFDVEVLFRRPPQMTPDKQREIIDSLLAQQVSAMAVSVINPKEQTDYLNMISEKVPLVTFDTDAPHSKRLCYIGTQNYEAGKAVGQLVRKALPDGGVIAIFVGDTAPLNAQERRQGVLDELA